MLKASFSPNPIIGLSRYPPLRAPASMFQSGVGTEAIKLEKPSVRDMEIKPMLGTVRWGITTECNTGSPGNDGLARSSWDMQANQSEESYCELRKRSVRGRARLAHSALSGPGHLIGERAEVKSIGERR
jgi:hypothetical protein